MHMLITGVSLSGKTTLAHFMAHQMVKKGTKIAVRDPVGTPTAVGDWPKEAKRFADDYEFLEWIHSPQAVGYVVFVDEAGDLFGQNDRDLHWMFTRGRHYALTMIPIAQRPKMLSPNVRSQCHHVFAFRLAQEDMREVAADMGHSDLHKIELDTGDFLSLRSGTVRIEHGNIFQLLKGKQPCTPT